LIGLKKKIIFGAIGLVTAAVLLVGFLPRSNGTDAVAVRATALEQGNLAVSVSITGTVHSSDVTHVYSPMNFPVREVNVRVGDRVAEGDVLAQLDTTSLETDIARQRASVYSAQANARQNLTTAQQGLAIAQHNAANDLDSSMLTAQSSINSAEQAVRSAEQSVQSASLELSIARRNLREARDNDWDDDWDNDTEIRNLRDAVRRAELTLESRQADFENRQADLERAKESFEAVRATQEQNIINQQNQVTSAQLSQNFNDQWIVIHSMEADLETGTITSPVYGTVTAVLVEEGGPSSGLMFVISNTDDLLIHATIREFDISQVSEGDSVVIRSDGTGNEEFRGVLSHIAPTTTTSATGQIANTTDAEFMAEVTVVGNNSLRIGMNTRMNIITEEVRNVYSVPFEAVVHDSYGRTVVFAVVEQEYGNLAAKMIEVETGLENDLFIAITSDALSDGMLIISDPNGISDGYPVELRGAITADRAAPTGGGFAFGGGGGGRFGG